MKEITPFFKSILLFIPFSVAAYITFIVIAGIIPFQFLKPNINYRIGSYGHMYSRINEIKNYKNIDILFLGSSHCYRGFDTRIFKKEGFSVFNLGSSGQTYIQTYVLLERYLKLLNPKMIILEVSPEIFESDGVESSMDIIANDKNDLFTLTSLIKWNNIKTINTGIFGFYNDLFKKNKDFIENKKKGKDLYISGGFVEKELMYYNPGDIKKKTIKLKDEQILAFNKVIEKIKEKDIKLILVQAPITKSRYNSFLNSPVFDNMMVTTGEYYNFNNLIELNDSVHFYDSHHLNQKGVSTFNKELITILKLKEKVRTHNNVYKK